MTLSEHLMARLRPGSKMEVDETPRVTGRFYLGRVAQEQMSEYLEIWTAPVTALPMRDLKLRRTKPLAVDE